jgi:spore coat polysaccharide biosynthesis protein SpsF
MLARVVERTRRARLVDDVVVATTNLVADDAIAALGATEGWRVERGSEVDLLDRYISAARSCQAATIVRITSDCPLIDPDVIDETIAAYHRSSADYASNTLEPRMHPRGLDVEVVARTALEVAWREDANMAWREHATPYLYRHPERFSLTRVAIETDHSVHRWCVDTAEDLELVTRIYEAIGRDDFGWREVLNLLERHPDWIEINRGAVQKRVSD